MKRNLLVDLDKERGLWRHRYGNRKARVVILKTTKGLSQKQLADCDAMLDLAIEHSLAGEKEIARVVLSPLMAGVFPPEERAEISIDTRDERLH